MIENIKILFKQLNAKTKFCGEVAEHFGKKPMYIRNHWFATYWAIPNEYQSEVLKLVESKLEAQKLQTV